MKIFEKSSKLDNVLYDVRGPVVDEAARMEEDGMEILKLNIGNPYPFGFSAPQGSNSGHAEQYSYLSGDIPIPKESFRKKGHYAVCPASRNSRGYHE